MLVGIPDPAESLGRRHFFPVDPHESVFDVNALTGKADEAHGEKLGWLGGISKHNNVPPSRCEELDCEEPVLLEDMLAVNLAV